MIGNAQRKVSRTAQTMNDDKRKEIETTVRNEINKNEKKNVYQYMHTCTTVYTEAATFRTITTYGWVLEQREKKTIDKQCERRKKSRQNF